MRCQFVLLLVGLLSFLSFDFVTASHFRYGSVTSQTTAGSYKATFTVTVGLRRSYYFGLVSSTNYDHYPTTGENIDVQLMFYFGDGQAVSLIPKVIAVGDSPFLNQDKTSIPTNDWFLAQQTIEYTYQYLGAYEAYVYGNARLLDLNDGNANLAFTFKTKVVVGSGTNSPVSSLPPVINVTPKNGVYTFNVPVASDDPTDVIQYIILTKQVTANTGLIKPNPDGLSINQTTGLVTWNIPTGEKLGWYALQVRIFQNTPAGVTKSYIVVDFLLYLQAEQTVYHPPSFIAPTPSIVNPNGVISVAVGATQFIPIAATDVLDLSTVTINHAGVPPHCTWTTTPGVVAIAGITCSPVAAESGGVWLITLLATEPHGLQVMTSFPYTVTGGGAIGDPQFTGFAGQSYQVHGVSDAIYNILSSSHLQYNALFRYLDSGKCRPGTACYSHPGNYFGEVGILFSSPEAEPLHVLVSSGSVTDGLTVTVNNVTLPVGEAVSSGMYKLTVVSQFQVEIDSQEFAIRIQNSDRFLNQDVAIETELMQQVAEYKRAVKAGEVSQAAELAAKLPHGLLGQSWSTKTYANRWKHIEGHLFDYQVQDGIMGKEFKYNRF